MPLFKTTRCTHQTLIDLDEIGQIALSGQGNTIRVSFFDAPDEILKYKSREAAELEFKELCKEWK